jgi:restriction endonuclease S subunit
MKKVYLKDISNISAGYSFRSALDWQTNGNTYILQANNISENIEINESELRRINFDDQAASAIIFNNDVVISSRGNFRAAVVVSEAKNILATSSVYLLRIKSNQLLGEYLAIYLNSKSGQKQLLAKSTGGIINTILRKDVEEIEVPIISLNNQRQIINLYKNNQQLKKVFVEKINLTDKIIAGTINNLLNSK